MPRPEYKCTWRKVEARGNHIMRHLPEIVLNEIFSYLAVRDLCACCCVCRKWSGILHSESAFWENRLSRETPQAFEDNPLIQKLPTAKHKLAAYQSTWSSEDHSENIYVKDDKITIHRNPVALSSDLARGRKGYSSGEHYWTVMWHGPKFGSNAIVGIATKDSNRHCEGYHPLLGMCKNSWGWDLSRCVLRHNGEELGDYPSNNGEIKVPMKINGAAYL